MSVRFDLSTVTLVLLGCQCGLVFKGNGTQQVARAKAAYRKHTAKCRAFKAANRA